VFGDDFSITEVKAVSVQTDLFGNPVADRPHHHDRLMWKTFMKSLPSPVEKNINNTLNTNITWPIRLKTRRTHQNIKTAKTFCFDTETTGTDPTIANW
jgi:DNA polymerase-1